MTNKTQKGYLIIEVMMAIVLFSMVVLTLFGMLSFLQRRTQVSTFEANAGILMQEGMEIAHNALIANWGSYPDDTYKPVFVEVDKRWDLLPGEETEIQTRYSRKIKLSQVCRNTSNGEQIELSSCASLGGVIDKNSKLVITTIGWMEKGAPKELTASFLVFHNDQN